MEKESEEGLKLRAYAIGLKLKNSGLDQETIYARLEKQGIPAELAKEVASNIIIERNKDTVVNAKADYNLSIIIIVLSLLLATISAIVIPDKIIIPVGLIITGVGGAIVAKDKMKF